MPSSPDSTLPTGLRLQALRRRRRAEGRCASCEKSSMSYYCERHQAARNRKRRRKKKRAGRYLSLQKPQDARRRLGIGYGFLGLTAGDLVQVRKGDQGAIKIRLTRRADGFQVRRSAHGSLYVSVALADFPEDQYPVQKYLAVYRREWIVARPSAQPVPHRASPAGVAASRRVDAVRTAGDLKPLAVEVVEAGRQRAAAAVLDHGDDPRRRRTG